MTTIEYLRKGAELNLCETCFKKYKALIEPSIKEWLFNPIDDWRKVESNITRMVMITKKVFKGKNELLSLDEGLYLFRWDKIPVRDNWKLIKFLKQNYNIDWVKTAKIKKINGGKTIKLFTEINSLSLILNDENTVSLKIDDGRTDEFIVRIGNNHKEIYKEYTEGSKVILGVEVEIKAFRKVKGMDFTEKIDHLYNKRILNDFSHRVLDEANKVRNKIHDPSIVAQFSEQDLTLFHIAHLITYNILISTRNDFGENDSANRKSDAEKFAEQCLLKLNL